MVYSNSLIRAYSRRCPVRAIFISIVLGGLILAGQAQAAEELPWSSSSTQKQGPVSKFYQARDPDKRIPGSYIVVLNKHSGAGNIRAAVAANANLMARMVGGKVTHQYSASVQGFAIEADPAAIGALINDPAVAYVEEDVLYHLVDVQNNPTWGLDRIDERTLPLDDLYDSDLSGFGVNAYIIDTGLDLDHPDFSGRGNRGFDAIGDGRNGNDCNGHGTHVGGTVGSETWGVAKDVELYSVRVFACGSTTSLSNILAGMDWVLDNAQLPAVANMSLGGPPSTTQDDLVEDMVDAGITVVVAAGNSNTNACNSSPGSAPEAITVASSTVNDSRSGFSNFGSCVDIFGPGSSITSTWLNGGTRTISGTSMASPHVAGAAALVLEDSPGASPAQVTNSLLSNATTGEISNVAGSPNRLLYMAYLNGGTPPPPPPPDDDCAFEDDFTTSTGWFNSSASTCSTGSFVRTNPTQQSNNGVITQVGGDSGGDGFAAFTATNSSAGNADVDGGVCIAQSPTIAVNQASTLSIDWFHGQRDSGDDPGGDFFDLEVSTNGGASFSSLVSIGDSRTQAQWATATASIPAGSDVVIRVSAADGSGPGDLVEGGVDQVSICPN